MYSSDQNEQNSLNKHGDDFGTKILYSYRNEIDTYRLYISVHTSACSLINTRTHWKISGISVITSQEFLVQRDNIF